MNEKELNKLLKMLEQLMRNAYMQGVNIAAVKQAIAKGDDGFFYSRNASANKQMGKVIEQLATGLDTLLLTNVEDAWVNGEEDNYKKLSKKTGVPVPELKEYDAIRDRATNNVRKQTAKQFYTEKREGLSISDRVWNIADGAKAELETIIQNGILEGKSAQQISAEIRKRDLLNSNDNYKRVLNKKTGKMEWSKAAKKHKPGQGVYRSATANIMRLVRTEVNAAYRMAQWQAWQNNPLIIGFKIVLSNNHTTKVNGKVIEFFDVCDRLQGEYPKTFKWTGWHPQCRCEMLAILAPEKDFKTRLKEIKEGKDTSEEDQITKVPKAYTDWVEENKEKAKKSVTPRFVRDNTQFAEAAPLDANALNIEKVESILGIKRQKEMSFEEANELRGNINFEKGIGYKINCQSCVVANELRRRGFNVTARENTGKKGNIPNRLSNRTEMAWIDKNTGEIPKKQKAGGSEVRQGKVKTKSRKQMVSELRELTKEVGRYHIDFAWSRSRSGHIICVEKLSDGDIRIYDPQTGKLVYWPEISRRISLKHGIKVLKVDDLLVNTDIIDGVVTKLD